MSTSNGAFSTLTPQPDTASGVVTPQTAPVDPDNPIWGIGAALLMWVVSILLQIVVPLFFLIPYLMQKGLSPSSPEFGAAVIALAKDRTAILLQVLAVFPTHFLTLLFVWAVVTRFGRRPFLASFGWSWSKRWGPLEGVGFFGLGVLLFVVGGVMAKLLGADKPTELEQLINSSHAARYAIAVLAVFTAPFVEEFVYRGMLYSALQRVIGIPAAVVGVLGLFTLIHVPQYWPNIGVIAAVALLSIVLTAVRAYTGRLLPCVILHMAFNAVQAVILVVEPWFHHAVPTTEPAVPTASLIIPLIQMLF